MEKQIPIVDEATGKAIASEVKLADGFFKRFRGLMLRKKLRGGEAMLFDFKRPGRHGVHMFFVTFPIDLVYLDSGGRVVEVRSRLQPWRIHNSKAESTYLLELPAGTVDKFRVGLGHRISRGKGFNPPFR